MLHSLARRLPSAMRPSYARRVLLLLFLILVLDYADRALIGAMAPTLKREFSLNNAKLGFLSGTFVLVSAGAVIPLGVLTDRVNRTGMLAIVLVIWTCAITLTGASVSAAMLFGSRVLLGAISAATGPTVPSIVGDLVPPARRGAAVGAVGSGQLVGTGAGYILGALGVAVLSFRWGFWLLAIAGAALALAFWRVGEPRRVSAAQAAPARPRDERERRPARQAEERAHLRRLLAQAGVEPSDAVLLRRDPATLSLWSATRYVVRVRTDVIVIGARMVGDYFFAGVTTFAVVFATEQYGIAEGAADLAMLVLGVGALAGILVGGWMSDALFRRGHLNGRVWLGALGFALAPLPLLPALFTHSLALALPLITCGAFLAGSSGPPLDAIRVDVVVPRVRGRAEAVRQVLRTAAEGSAPALFGLLAGARFVGATGAQLAFLVTLPALLFSGLIVLLALRTYQRDLEAALVSTEQLNHPSRPGRG